MPLSLWGSPRLSRKDEMCHSRGVGDTTWYRGRRSILEGCLANPVASSSSVEPSQRAERGGSLFNLDKWLKVRANPLGNQAPTWRPDRSKCGGTWIVLAAARSVKDRTMSCPKCCDALRCSGPHARYTDRASEYITLAERPG